MESDVEVADLGGVAQYFETLSSSILPVTRKTTRSQMLVTRSAMRSRLCATSCPPPSRTTSKSTLFIRCREKHREE